MKLIITILLITFSFGWSNQQIVDSIYKAEGGVKASKPFGILSVECEGYDECRQICLNTVRNTRERWIKAGKPKDFISFLGDRYCPPEAHPLNKHWVDNVKYFLKQEAK